MWCGDKAAHFEALATLAIETRARKIPCVSPENGYFLYTMARAVGAKRVLEIGTATGVSTLYFAAAVGPEGHIDTLEKNRVDAEEAKNNFVTQNRDEMISLHVGDALETLAAGLPGPYDLIFVDAMKREYLAYAQAVLPRLRPGGLLIFDDVIKFGHKMEDLFQWLAQNHLPATIVPTDPDDGVLIHVAHA